MIFNSLRSSQTSFTTFLSERRHVIGLWSLNNIWGMPTPKHRPCTPIKTAWAVFIFSFFLSFMIVLKEVNREVFCFCSSCLYLSITISSALSKCPVAELCGWEKSVPERIPGRALCFWLLLLCWHCVFYVRTCIMCLIVSVYAQHKCL